MLATARDDVDLLLLSWQGRSPATHLSMSSDSQLPTIGVSVSTCSHAVSSAWYGCVWCGGLGISQPKRLKRVLFTPGLVDAVGFIHSWCESHAQSLVHCHWLLAASGR